MSFLKKLLKLLFSTFGNSAKEKIKHQIDEKSKNTDSEFVKKRNDLEKAAIDLIDEKIIDAGFDKIENLKNKKK